MELNETAQLAIAAAVVLAFVAVAVLYLLAQKRRVRRGTFVILGLTNSGKTAIYYQLRHGQLVETQASLEINEDTFPLHSERKSNASQRAALRPLHIVDIPGHEKLRFRLLDFERQVGGVVFVIDAAAVHSQLRQVSEYLYDVLSNATLQKNAVPVLVVLNKNDLPTAQPIDRVQSSLQSEFNTLRKTRSAAPDRQDDAGRGGDQTSAFLGYDNKTFEFSDLENEVSFVECSAKTGADSLRPIEIWLRNQYPLAGGRAGFVFSN